MQRLVCSVAVLSLCLASTGLAGDWPQWRGPDRADRSDETGLMPKWPNGYPKLQWSISSLGIGHAGPAIADGKMYILCERNNAGEILVCLELPAEPQSSRAKVAPPKELWTAKVGGHYDNGWGDGPRSTPTVDGDRVYAVGSLGNLICAKASDGSIVWQKNLGGAKQGWGFTQSPLVDDKFVYGYQGGKGTVSAYDKMTGDVKWTSESFGDNSHYSSLIKVEHNGTPTIIQLREKSVNGFDVATGKTLWKSQWPGKVAVIPTPIYHDGHVFVTSGYNVGCKLFKIGNNQPTDIYQHDNKSMVNHHGGVILVGDHLYGHSDSQGWMCIDFKSGKTLWNHKARDFGKGAVTYADGKLYIYTEKDGKVALVDASPKGWKVNGSFTIPKKTSHDRKKGKIWVHPVISGGKLYLRDNEHLFCYDVRLPGKRRR